jgi:hypothetical protein
MSHWSRHAYHNHHHWACGALAEIDLFAQAWAAVVQAGVCALRDDRARAIAALEEAVARMDATHDRLAAACLRIRLGMFLGDDKGRALVEAGEAFMREQGIGEPQRMAAALAPGVDR